MKTKTKWKDSDLSPVYVYEHEDTNVMPED